MASASARFTRRPDNEDAVIQRQFDEIDYKLPIVEDQRAVGPGFLTSSLGCPSRPALIAQRGAGHPSRFYAAATSGLGREETGRQVTAIRGEGVRRVGSLRRAPREARS